MTLVLGVILFLTAGLPAFFAMQNVMQDPFNPSVNGSVSGSFFLSFLLGAAGIVLIVFGFAALRFGLIRPVSTYVAVEAAPAIQTAAAALGGGLRDAGFGPTPAAGSRTDVRIKCRNCGYLETEDAEFCSKCGQRI